MLGRLYQITLCFLLATQPASRSLSTDLYFRLPDTGQPMLVTLVDTAAAELTNSIVDHLDSDKLNNGTDSSEVTGYKSSSVIVNVVEVDEKAKSVESNESHGETRPEIIVRAVPKEKEDKRATTDKVKEVTVISNDTDNIVSDDSETDVDSDVVEDVTEKEVETPPSQIQEEIPSFSEWTQKQLEEAEKNKDNTVNRSQSTPGVSNSNSNMKVRSKNYASLDCGAKLVAANPESGSASHILNPNKDEYMLNTCTSRIWFVVEMCEAIQAKKVDMANFELFSSTPKNFSVYVSDRFPTREWTSVGQFIAKDEKDIQTFNLHPHLFGKFVKVEIHSYYGSEHYCPISLFRVYGTSEYEVFETENSPHSHSSQTPDDEDDDDILEDLNTTEKEDKTKNLFGSARDAVLSIVKKAAQVLVKSSDAKNTSQSVDIIVPKSSRCKTPSHIIVCDNCSNSMFTDVFNLLSCHGDELDRLVQTPVVRDTLCNTDICQNFGLDFKSRRTSYVTPKMSTYISTFLFPSYIAALCNMLAIIEKKVVLNTSYEAELNVTTNLTIDKKVHEAVKDGNLNDLIQKPFATCTDASDPQCIDDAKLDSRPINIAPEIVASDLSGIKPTRTINSETDSKDLVMTSTGSITDRSTSSERDRVHTIAPSIVDTKIEGSELTHDSIQNSAERSVDEINDSVVNDNLKSDDKLNSQMHTQSPDSKNVVNNSDVKSGSVDSSVVVDEAIIKITAQDQISLDILLKELEQVSADGGQVSADGGHNQINTMPSSQGQKESVFLRLSNRIKALERNMSLSGQYLEELSRRYRKQMEEMQKTFEKTLATVSEEAKKAEERDVKSAKEMLILQKQLAELSTSVNVLISERDSLFGILSLPKIILSQIIVTILVFYLIKKYTTPVVPERKISKVKINVKTEKDKVRRKSSEVPVSVSAIEIKPEKKRRPSEEALHITRAATEMRENLKGEKKGKRKRKSPIIQRSYSIAIPPEVHLLETGSDVSEDKSDLSGLAFSKDTLNAPIALDEPEFLIPEIDPIIDFHGSDDSYVINGSTAKKDFSKTNGSIFGKKTDLSRRLSSPAFIKAALGRSSGKSAKTPLPRRSVSPSSVKSNRMLPLEREVRSEERIVKRELDSPQLSTWSSIGDNISDTSGSVKGETQSVKKRSKSSFKSIFKKVF